MTKRILVIEDEPQMLLGLRDNLELEGYEVVTASDGEDGLAKAISTAPDLVILDVTLPRKNGFEVCRELRARPHPPLPVHAGQVVLHGLRTEEQSRRDVLGGPALGGAQRYPSLLGGVGLLRLRASAARRGSGG